MSARDNLSPQQFFHGTTKYFRPGDKITPGQPDRWVASSPHHVYFTEDRHLASEYAGMRDDPEPEKPTDDRYSVYQVRPTGPYERDPNHDGGPASEPEIEPNWRSRQPLEVVRRLPMSHRGIAAGKYMK